MKNPIVEINLNIETNELEKIYLDGTTKLYPHATQRQIGQAFRRLRETKQAFTHIK